MKLKNPFFLGRTLGLQSLGNLPKENSKCCPERSVQDLIRLFGGSVQPFRNHIRVEGSSGFSF